MTLKVHTKFFIVSLIILVALAYIFITENSYMNQINWEMQYKAYIYNSNLVQSKTTLKMPLYPNSSDYIKIVTVDKTSVGAEYFIPVAVTCILMLLLFKYIVKMFHDRKYNPKAPPEDENEAIENNLKKPSI